MKQKKEKNELLRKQIIDAARVYRDCLAGRVFLYVVGETFFEIVFQVDRFKHLTGVDSKLSARDFYHKAKHAILTTDQMYFNKEHPYSNAKKKLSCLVSLPMLTNSLVCAVKDMKTVTLTYKIGVTNLNFTLGLVENRDREGKKINDWFLPRTLRVKDKAIEKSMSAEFVDFIFCKDASKEKYDTVTFSAKGQQPPSSVRPFLTETVWKSLCPKEKE